MEWIEERGTASGSEVVRCTVLERGPVENSTASSLMFNYELNYSLLLNTNDHKDLKVVPEM